MEEGDNTLTGYTWITSGTVRNQMLCYVVGLLYTMAGMAFEPQDRTGRVNTSSLLDATGRVEFTSRVYSLTPDCKKSVWFPKMRKTFSCSVTDIQHGPTLCPKP